MKSTVTVADVANRHWITGAIKHPGALHREMGVPAGQKIPEKRLAAASKKGGKLGRRARLAQTLKRMHHKRAAKESLPARASKALYGK